MQSDRRKLSPIVIIGILFFVFGFGKMSVVFDSGNLFRIVAFYHEIDKIFNE